MRCITEDVSNMENIVNINTLYSYVECESVFILGDIIRLKITKYDSANKIDM